MSLAFRDATEADVGAVVALLADDRLGSGREVPGDPAYLAGFRAMMAQGGRIILAVSGEEVVGCLQLNMLWGVSHRGGCRAQVEGVRVSSAHRGAGVGRAMMREAMRVGRAAGASGMQLTTNSSRGDAQRFYVSLGFSASHVGMKLEL